MTIKINRLKQVKFKLPFHIVFLILIAFYQLSLASGQRLYLSSDLYTFSDPHRLVSISYDPSPYRLDFYQDIALIGGGVVMGVSGLMLIKEINPLTPGEIAKLNPSDINPFDRHAMRPYREAFSGGTMLYGSFLLPLTFLSDERMRHDWKVLALIGAEVLLIQSGLTIIIKSLTLRTRPYAFDPNVPQEKKTSISARLSFYSGHTSTTAAISFYVAKVFSDYHTDSTVKSLIWAGAALYPAIVAYLRVDSGQHFPTDVIAGYIMGALIGYFIPEIHKVGIEKKINVAYRHIGKHMGLEVSYNF